MQSTAREAGKTKLQIENDDREFDSPSYVSKNVAVASVIEGAERGVSFLAFRFPPRSWQVSRRAAARGAKISGLQLDYEARKFDPPIHGRPEKTATTTKN